jgi:hypothetical protein
MKGSSMITEVSKKYVIEGMEVTVENDGIHFVTSISDSGKNHTISYADFKLLARNVNREINARKKSK